MKYKDFDIKIEKDWDLNVSPPLSRYIVYRVTNNERSWKFIFNNNFLNKMAQDVGGVKTDEAKLQTEALNEIQKFIDSGIKDEPRLVYFERYPGNFIYQSVPKWYWEIINIEGDK